MRYDANLGIGYVPGNVSVTTNANCTAANAGDPSCYLDI